MRPRRGELDAAAAAQAKPTPSVDAVVALAQLVRAQIQAEEAAARGEYAHAHGLMMLFRTAAAGRGHDAVAQAAAKIADRVADAGRYDSSVAYRSSMRKGSARGVQTLFEAEAQGDLRSMGQAKTTAAQEQMADAFGAVQGPAKPRATKSTSGALARKRSRRW